MRIIANENITGSVIRQLRETGHDVLSVKETIRGANDADVLSQAQAEQRLVITHDKDFGELAAYSDEIGHLVRGKTATPLRVA